MKKTVKILSIALCFILCSCETFPDYLGAAEKREYLVGKRERVLGLDSDVEYEVEESSKIIYLPEAKINEHWDKSDQSQLSSHEHLFIEKDYELVKKTTVFRNIFNIFGKNIELKVNPVFDEERMYLFDNDNNVIALDRNNPDNVVWKKSMVHISPFKDVAITGGIAEGGGNIFVSNGSEIIYALDSETGETKWFKRLGNATKAAPVYVSGRVFIRTFDNKLYTIDASNGKVLWTHDGVIESIGSIDSASVAVKDRIIILPQSSGELYALDILSGMELWAVNLSYEKSITQQYDLSDIDVTPAFIGDQVIVSNISGKLFALDINTGNIDWKLDNIYANYMWVAGEALYIMNKNNNLFAVNTRTGKIAWIHQLEKPDKKNQNKYSGPILAGNMLIVVGSNGRLLEVSPKDGSILKTRKVEKNITTGPIIVDKKLYLLSNDGALGVYQ